MEPYWWEQAITSIENLSPKMGLYLPVAKEVAVAEYLVKENMTEYIKSLVGGLWG